MLFSLPVGHHVQRRGYKHTWAKKPVMSIRTRLFLQNAFTCSHAHICFPRPNFVPASTTPRLVSSLSFSFFFLFHVFPVFFFVVHTLFFNTSLSFMVQVSLSGLSAKRLLQFLLSNSLFNFCLQFFSRGYGTPCSRKTPGTCKLPLIPNSIRHISPRRTWHMSVTNPDNALSMCHPPLPTNTRHISLPYGFSSWVYPTHTQCNKQNTYHPKGQAECAERLNNPQYMSKKTLQHFPSKIPKRIRETIRKKTSNKKTIDTVVTEDITISINTNSN